MQALLNSVPPTLQQVTVNLCLCQRLLDTHGQIWVSYLWGYCFFLLGPGMYNFLFVPSKSVFPHSYVSSGSSFSKRAYAIPKSAAPSPSLLHPEPLPLQQSTADTYLHRRHSKTVLSQSLWGLWVLVQTRFIWALWTSLTGVGFGSKCNFAPPTILLVLPLCPWTWGISSKSPQHIAATVAVPTILKRLLCPWTWGITSQSFQHHAAAAIIFVAKDGETL